MLLGLEDKCQFRLIMKSRSHVNQIQICLHNLILSSRNISGKKIDSKYQNLCRKREKRRQVKVKKG